MHVHTKPRRRPALLGALALTVSLGCDDGGGGRGSDAAPGDGAVAQDATPADGAAPADVAPDGAAATDAAPDALPPDAAAADAAAADAGPEPDAAPLPPCPPPPAGEAPPGGRWVLSMFHFNVQYVAGGLEGYAAAAFGNPDLAPRIDATAEAVEDLIVTESLVPLLEMLDRNEGLALTLEMQGYMVDVMRARHPAALDLMRRLANAGKAELASIHWSDQFFLAFGREDMDESWRRTQASFAAAGLPLSRAVFTQEGQFGEGFAEWLAERRPDAVMVMPRNLQGFFRRDLADAPLFKVGALDVVLPRGLGDGVVERQWSFFDDGELLATNDQNPYFANTFRRHEPSVRAYEHELRCARDNGWRVGRVSDYVDAVRAAGYEAGPLGPFVDGTWQPGSTRGPLRWMGGGGLYKKHERDNEVLTTCVRARGLVLALQAADPRSPALDDAWRHLLWGQVSDARGINPWLGEVRYGLDNCGRAAQLAEDALRDAAAGSAAIRVDTGTGAVERLRSRAPLPARVPVAAPVEVQVADHGGRPFELAWTVESGRPAGPDNPPTLEVRWAAHPDLTARYENCLLAGLEDFACAQVPPAMSIRVPRDPGAMVYRPALGTALRRHVEADFALSGDARSDGVWYPAADGLVGLGGDRFLVKDTASVHLAWGWPAGEDRNDAVVLRDETQPAHLPVTWRFRYVEGEAAALRWADRNLRPVVEVPAR
jgi:hypothetical protein